MEDILKKCIDSEAQKDLVDDVIEKFTLLKKSSDNFQELIKDDQFCISDQLVEIFIDFMYAYSYVYAMVDNNKLIEEVTNNLSELELKFWNNLIKFFNGVKITQEETCFIRKMNTSDFEDLISHTFYHYILHNNILKQYKCWNKEKINITRRIINTFVRSMIEGFNDYDNTILIINLKFQFNDEQNKYIWSLCEANKTFLMMKNITEQLNILNYRS